MWEPFGFLPADCGGREGEREGGREGGRERGREGGREGGRKGGREGGREEGREGGWMLLMYTYKWCVKMSQVSHVHPELVPGTQ